MLLVQSLLPVMLHAAPPVNAHELCTGQGVKTLLVLDEGGAAGQHCQLCVVTQQDAHPGPKLFVFHPQVAHFFLAPQAEEMPRASVPLVLRLRGPPLA